MKVYKWNNRAVGDFDLFVFLSKDEMKELVTHYNTESAKSATFDDIVFYYLINSPNKTITPLPLLAFAFGGQYNDSLPFGDEIDGFILDLSKYKLKLFN